MEEQLNKITRLAVVLIAVGMIVTVISVITKLLRPINTLSSIITEPVEKDASPAWMWSVLVVIAISFVAYLAKTYIERKDINTIGRYVYQVPKTVRKVGRIVVYK